MSTVQRGVRTLVGALALTALGVLAGCTTVGRATPSAEELARPPRISSCWHLPTQGFGSPMTQVTGRDCTEPHEEETVWVATNALPAAQAYPRSDQLSHAGPVRKALDDVCNGGSVAAYVGDTADHALFVSYGPRLPGEQEWEAGARWVRCDVMYGVNRPDPAPGTMANALKGRQAAAYRACYVGTSQTHELVPCSKPHEAEVLEGGIDLTSLVPIPADDQRRQAMAQTLCKRPLEYALGPDNVQPAGTRLELYDDSRYWEPGSFVATCVLVRVDGARSSTVLLP